MKTDWIKSVVLCDAFFFWFLVIYSHNSNELTLKIVIHSWHKGAIATGTTDIYEASKIFYYQYVH